MNKLLKAVLILGALVIALAIGALIAIPLVFDPNTNKEWLSAKVQAATGRSLALDGHIDMTWYPWLGVNIPGITLGNAEGFGPEPFLRAELLQVRVKLVPLLRRNIEMDTVRIHGATVNLAVAADGRNNWADLSKPSEEQTAPLPFSALAIGGVDIKDARVNYTDATTGKSVKVEKISASTGSLTPGAPIDLTVAFDTVSSKPAVDGSFVLKGTIAYADGGERVNVDPLTLTGEYRGKSVPNGKAPIEFTGPVELDLDAGTFAVPAIRLATLGATLSGKIAAQRIQTDAPALQSEFTAQGSDIAAIIRVLEGGDLAKQLAKLDSRAFELRAKLDADKDTGIASLSDLNVKMLGATITGRVDTSRIDTDRPSAKGELKAVGPDLPMLLRVAGQFEAGKDRTLARLGKALAQTRDKAFDIDARFDLDRDKGTLKAPKFSAKLLGATITGNIDASGVESDALRMKGDFDARGPDLPAILIVLGYLNAEEREPGAKLEKPGLAKLGANLAGAPDRAFNFSSRFDADMKRGNFDLPELNAAALGMVLKGNLKASDFSGSKGTINGRFALQGDRIGPLLRAMEQPGLADVVQNLNVEAGVTGSGGDIAFAPFAAKAVLAGKNIPNSPVTATLSADARANLDKQTLSLENLSLSGLGLDARGSLNATGIDTDPNYTGTIAIQPFDLRRLLVQLNQKVPVTADPEVLKRVAWSSEFAGTKDSIDFRKFALTLDQTNATGTIKVAHFADPDIAFGVTVDGINADRYLAPKTKAAPLPAAPAPAPTAPVAAPVLPPDPAFASVAPPPAAPGTTSQLPLETIRKLNLKGDLTIGSLQYAGARLTDVKLNIDSRGGRLNLDPLAARLYQGGFQGKVGIDATGAQALMNVDATLANVQLGPLLRDAAKNDKVEGAGNVSLKVYGGGNDTLSIKRSLNGTGSFSIVNGLIRGVDAQASLYQVELALEQQNLGALANARNQGGQTPFEQLNGTLDIKNGMVHNRDLVMRAPGITANGAGMLIDLRTDQIKYDFAVGVDKTRVQTAQATNTLGGYRIPIRCRGTVTNPSCLPDAGEIGKQFGMNLLKGYLTGQQSGQGGVGGLLQGLVGGGQAPAPAPLPGAAPAPGAVLPPAPAPQKPKKIEDVLKEKALKGLFGD